MFWALSTKSLVISDDLDYQAVKMKSLEEKAVQMKVSFADHVFSLKQAHTSGFAGPSFFGQAVSGPSYASVARGNLSGSVLVAKCDDVSAPPLDVQAVEELKVDITKNRGLIPSHVRYKNNMVFCYSRVAVATRWQLPKPPLFRTTSQNFTAILRLLVN